MKTSILETLRAAAPDWVSSEVLREPTGVSRAAISKQVKRLAAMGYEIESSPRKGYRLVGQRDSLAANLMRLRLEDTRFAKGEYVYRQMTDSTNDDVREMARGGAPEGSLVVAEVQQAGRGRLGRKWFNRAGDSLQVTVLLRPPLSPRRGTLIPLMAASAIYRALEKLGVKGVGIKWPNDVLVDGMKLCGILCEMSVDMDRIEFATLGIGMNVNTPGHEFPGELRGVACSLASATGHAWMRGDVLEAVLRELEALLVPAWDGDLRPVLEAWRQGAATLGREIDVCLGNGRVIRGVAEDVDENGALRLRDADGVLHTLHSGEASLGSDGT